MEIASIFKELNPETLKRVAKDKDLKYPYTIHALSGSALWKSELFMSLAADTAASYDRLDEGRSCRHIRIVPNSFVT